MSSEPLMIQVSLNGRQLRFPAGITLGIALEQQGLTVDQPGAPAGSGSSRIATAVNQVFVSRPARDRYVLVEGDVVTTFSPITGG